MEGLHCHHVTEDQGHEGWSATKAGGPRDPWGLEVREIFICFVNLPSLPQPHHKPDWNVLLHGLNQGPVHLAAEGEVPLLVEVLQDLHVRGHPRQHRLRGQVNQRGCCFGTMTSH